MGSCYLPLLVRARVPDDVFLLLTYLIFLKHCHSPQVHRPECALLLSDNHIRAPRYL